MLNSLYKGSCKFGRKQLIFVVESVLIAARDRIEAELPTSCTWEDRVREGENPLEMSPYARGALESAGMTLAILANHLVDEGISVYDSLEMARDNEGMGFDRLLVTQFGQLLERQLSMPSNALRNIKRGLMKFVTL